LKPQCAIDIEKANMDPQETTESGQLDALGQVFADQLQACLEECTHGRRGLFSNVELTADEGTAGAWPEASRLRELGLALQSLFAQQDQRNALCDEFLDLCSMHGESHPGEPRLARMFLARIQRGEVGTPTQAPWKP
jgi:hypothetical protein